jgi:hypothetical protein
MARNMARDRIGKSLLVCCLTVNVLQAEVVRRPDALPAAHHSATAHALPTSPHALPTAGSLPTAHAESAEHGDAGHAVSPTIMSPAAKAIPLDLSLFGSDPHYPDSEYDPKAQYDIYGGKKAVPKVRPLLELGQPLYAEGPLNHSYDLIGAKNLVSPQLYVYGDWRGVAAVNDNGRGSTGLAATRLNLEVDLKLTATERLHALFRPLDHNGDFTRYQFSGGDNADDHQFEAELDAHADTFFFEGDLGAITSGITDEYVSWDVPFAVGLIPLVYQNGIWLDDAFYGGAVTALSSRNSPRFDITNMDVVVFGGSDKVSSTAITKGHGVRDGGANLLGVTTMIEAQEGYFEAGYAYTEDTLSHRGGDFSYHNGTLAFSKRYFGSIANSTRLIVNSGQDPGAGQSRTADGYVLLIENSLVTHLPSTLVPYANVFFGDGTPQSVARDAGAGGILKNTGLSFETDGLTGFPKLNDSGHDSWGGALGLQYLFSLNRQIVVEVATVQAREGTAQVGSDRPTGDQYALSARYQKPLNNAWIFRADAIVGTQENNDNLLGSRFELRRKF